MSTKWSTTTSKKGRKKKVAAIEKKANPEIDKKKKKSSKKRRNKSLNDNENEYNNNNNYNYNYNYNKNNNYNNNNNKEYYKDNDYYDVNRLTSKQISISQQISEFWPIYDSILPKVITQLDLKYFDPTDEKLKIQILDCIVSELQDAMSGKNRKKNKKNKQNKNNKNNKKTNKKTNKNNTQSKTIMKNKLEKKSETQLGKFMNCVGFIFLDFLDKETMSKLIRSKLFQFNNNNKKQLITNKQRLISYTSINDISYRINKFNNKLNTLSILKLYKIKNKNKKKNHKQNLNLKNLTTKQYLYYIICYGLKLLPYQQSQKQKHKQSFENNIVNINNINNINNFCNNSQKFMKTKFKQFNIWTATNINDLNEAYMIEFGEYNNNKNKNKNINGQSYLNYLNDFILDETILSKQNIKSMHCAYSKFIKNYELHAFIWLFVELKTKHLDGKDQCKQFMVWTGQCATNKF